MKTNAIPFRVNEKLILVPARVRGPRGRAGGRFALDTGASMTTLAPEFLDKVGYCARDGNDIKRVQTAVGPQTGYTLSLPAFESLGFAVEDLVVHVCDLRNLELDGLLGLNFLFKFNLEILPLQQQILVTQARA